MLLREKGEMEEKSVETKVNSKSVKKRGGSQGDDVWVFGFPAII